jgi:hypothetical protein
MMTNTSDSNGMAIASGYHAQRLRLDQAVSLDRCGRAQEPDGHSWREVYDGEDIEIGSIGRQFDDWVWGIDCVIPMRETESEGTGCDLKDCTRQFRAAWERFSSDPARLTEFLKMKRKQPR